MNASGFIAGRLKFQGRMAMGTIALSFVIMIVSIAVSSGFRKEIRDGLSAISGDVLMEPPGQNWLGNGEGVSLTPSYLEKIRSLEGVETITPVVYHAGMIKSGETIQGVVFKGVPSYSNLEVSISSRLASILNLSPGDKLTSYFVGERLKVRKFTVKDIYDGIIDNDDKMVVYAGLSDMQRLEGFDSTRVSALEITLKDSWKGIARMQEAKEDIGMIALADMSDDDDTLISSSAADRFPVLFSWLDLIDFNVLFIIVLMILVAGFNMISGLLIMLFRNISTIGTLKTLGMTDRQISAVFLKAALALVLKGMAVGNALAFIFCYVQGRTHFITLNPDNYFISFVPVSLNVPAVLIADIVAVGIIMLLLLLPTLFIARVDPAQTVRTN